MELRHIRYFLVVAEELNMTRAAAKLGMAQPPLSQQIKDLEAEVGALLFHRVAHGVELSEAGRAFLAMVETIPTQTERAKFAAQSASRGEMGSLQVGLSGSGVFSTLVPAVIRAFRNRYPRVEVGLEERNSAELIKGLRDNELDVVFLRPGTEPVAGLQMDIVSEEPLLAVLPAGHPAAQRPDFSLSAMRDDRFILFPRTIGPLFDSVMSACRNAGFEPVLGQPAFHIGSIVTLVAAELGVSIVPSSMRQLHHDGVTFRDLPDDVPSIKLAIARRRGDTSLAVRNFVSLALHDATG
ncbi:LysR family transcriptional regulator [Beijerinckia sp. L45]|uniref:LysR family transcriptional regulator n=1 Tax=Beijerinckia sp. L45 TaxID=1641855 RepID=UPI00131C780D|nr:LysR family transcriptional regulator [Beijerinckia sp. L45]